MPTSNSSAERVRRKQVWKKANGRCAHCGVVPAGQNRTIDHFIPRSSGGGWDMRNLMPLCRKCNEARDTVPVDPAQYYAFANHEAICAAIQYEREFHASHTNALHEIF